jgi:hypothetical protein
MIDVAVLAVLGLIEFLLRVVLLLVVLIPCAVTVIGLLMLPKLDVDPLDLLTPFCWQLLEAQIGGGRRG